MPITRGYKGRPPRSRWLYSRLFLIVFVAACYLWYCSDQGIHNSQQTRRMSASKYKSSSPIRHQKMALVLVPADVVLPEGSIALAADAVRAMDQVQTEGTGPGQEPPSQKKYVEHEDSIMLQAKVVTAAQPVMSKKYIEHWDSSSMQNTEPVSEQAMGKKYIEHWDSSMMEATAPQAMGKKYIEHWDSSSMQNTEPVSEQAMGKKYIEHWDSSMMEATEPQAMGKKYIEHWDSSSMQNTEPVSEQAMGKKYIEHWDSSMMEATAPQAMGKKYVDNWDANMVMAKVSNAGQPVMGKRYIEHWDSSMMAGSQAQGSDSESSEVLMPPQPPLGKKIIKNWEANLESEPVMEKRSLNLQAGNPLTMKFPATEAKWEPQAADQLVIITTMAIMALLVGAISARRLRHRRGGSSGDCLSACIENNVEDELAYDTATTFSGAYSAVGGVGVYDTFSQVSSANGWRNDLEKFDV